MPRGKLQEGKSGIESEENNKRRRNNNKPVVDREAVVVGNQNKAANEKKKMEKNKKAKINLGLRAALYNIDHKYLPRLVCTPSLLRHSRTA